MSVQPSAREALRAGVPFVAIMVLWILVAAVVYGGFVLVWPDVSGADPWMHLGVYVIPLVGYAGHTLHAALAGRERGTSTR